MAPLLPTIPGSRSKPSRTRAARIPRVQDSANTGLPPVRLPPGPAGQSTIGEQLRRAQIAAGARRPSGELPPQPPAGFIERARGLVPPAPPGAPPVPTPVPTAVPTAAPAGRPLPPTPTAPTPVAPSTIGEQLRQSQVAAGVRALGTPPAPTPGAPPPGEKVPTEPSPWEKFMASPGFETAFAVWNEPYPTGPEEGLGLGLNEQGQWVNTTTLTLETDPGRIQQAWQLYNAQLNADDRRGMAEKWLTPGGVPEEEKDGTVSLAKSLQGYQAQSDEAKTELANIIKQFGDTKASLADAFAARDYVRAIDLRQQELENTKKKEAQQRKVERLNWLTFFASSPWMLYMLNAQGKLWEMLQGIDVPEGDMVTMVEPNGIKHEISLDEWNTWRKDYESLGWKVITPFRTEVEGMLKKATIGIPPELLTGQLPNIQQMSGLSAGQRQVVLAAHAAITGERPETLGQRQIAQAPTGLATPTTRVV